MISYCSMGVKRKFVSSLSSLKQCQQEHSELKLILHQLLNQLSYDGISNPEKYSITVTNILIEEGSKCMKKCSDSDHLNNDSVPVHDEFACASCKEILNQPVTLACGHTFCLLCLRTENLKKCILCDAEISKEKLSLYKTNVILWNIVNKWHSTEITGRALFDSGFLYLEQGKLNKAISEFTNALVYTPNSHTVLVQRAEAYLRQNELSKALKDIHRAVQLAGKWSKTYFVQGEILFQEKYYEKALLSYLTAFVLNPSEAVAKQRMATIISKLLVPSSRRPSHSDGKKICFKRPSSDLENTYSVKRAYCRGAQEERPTESGRPEFLGRNFSSAHDLRRTSSASDKSLDSSFSLSDSSLNHSNLSPETERRLGRLLTAYFSSNCYSSSKNEAQSRQVEENLVDPSDFDCSLCYRLLHNPVCTPCGHTFCQFCIERSLDHGVKCPLCKQSIEESLAEQLKDLHTKCDYVTKYIIEKYLAKECVEREKQHCEEIREMNESQPVFVCTLAFPSVPCPLHIFEPRYRLMLRRCLEFNGREFGMCMPDAPNPHCSTGTLLKVRDVTYFPDGRSVVDSIGIRRFKTTNCELKDGYNVAKFEYIVDRPVRNPTATEELSTNVYNVASAWFSNLHPNLKVTISQHFGNFPTKEDKSDGENGPDWHWWILAVMPAENRVKATILGKNSYHERLLIMHRIFHCLQKRQNGRPFRDAGTSM